MAFILDAGIWRDQDARLQADVDMAAFSVGLARQQGLNDADIAKLLVFHADVLPAASTGTVFSLTDLGNGLLRVSGTRPTKKRFSRLLGTGAPTLKASADLSFSSKAPCLLSTNTAPLNGRGIELDNAGFISVSGCDIQSNATGSNSIYVNQGYVTAVENGGYGKICHGGGYYKPPYQSNAITGKIQQCPTATDPLAAKLGTPVPAGITYGNPGTDYSWYGTKTINPGIYASGLDVNNGRTIYLNAGTYYVTGGNFTTQNGSHLYANGPVTIIYTGTGNFMIGDGSGVHSLNAPTTGPYAGLLMWRPKQANCSNKIRFNGGATFKYDGILYFPGCELNMSNNAKIQTNTKFTYLVADRIYVTGSAGITLNVSSPYGLAATLSGGSGKFAMVR